MVERIDPSSILILDYLELSSMTESVHQWKDGAFDDNPPRYYRLLRMNACVRALGLEFGSWDNFQRGRIHRKDGADINNERIVNILTNLSRKEIELSEQELKGLDESFYLHMSLSMLRNIHQFKTLSGTILCASEIYFPPLFVLGRIYEDLENYKDNLDRVVSLILNPEKKRFWRKELIEEYGFPDVDLDKIDLDWI